LYKRPEGLPFLETLDDYHNQIAVRNLVIGSLMTIELRSKNSERVKRLLEQSLDFCNKSLKTLDRLVKDGKPTVDNYLSKVFIDLAMIDNEKVDMRQLVKYQENFTQTLQVLRQIHENKEIKDVEKPKVFLKNFIEKVKAAYVKTETLYLGFFTTR